MSGLFRHGESARLYLASFLHLVRRGHAFLEERKLEQQVNQIRERIETGSSRYDDDSPSPDPVQTQSAAHRCTNIQSSVCEGRKKKAGELAGIVFLHHKGHLVGASARQHVHLHEVSLGVHCLVTAHGESLTVIDLGGFRNGHPVHSEDVLDENAVVFVHAMDGCVQSGDSESIDSVVASKVGQVGLRDEDELALHRLQIHDEMVS